jgi:amino acid transporter
MFSGFRRFMLGNPLPTASEAEQRLSKLKALAVFSSDALSSVAYATEEILWVLILAGTTALGFSVPIALAIGVLAMIVAFSYYQTVHGYPSGGGAYIVARENLGVWPGLVAAAALLIGYVLTVSVSVAAGVGAVTSAYSTLFPYRVELCLLAIAVIAWGNLRGIKESGTVFAIPTYCFILILVAMIAIGGFRALTGSLTPAVPEVTFSTGSAGSVTLTLILRAFASGCAALTGIEAISNGVPAFKKPEARNAGITLIAMAVLLGILFLGVTFLTRALSIVPTEEETVVSQIGRQILGEGPLYLFLQAATAMVLVLAANTSFVSFPRLSAILAQSRYLPNQLTGLGDRLVFTNGILILALFSAILIIIFGSDTHQLIPLYAVGVFLSFTLSQTGMVHHWRRTGGPGWQWKALVNGIGAVATGVVMLIVLSANFARGAWIVAILIPACVGVFRFIRGYYGHVAQQLSLEGLKPEEWEDVSHERLHKIIIPVSGLHRGTLEALHFARSMSADVTAVIVDVEPERTVKTQQKWPTWGHGVPLVVLESPYRSTIRPLLAYLEEQDEREPERGLAVVVLPEFVPPDWWNHLFHNQTAILFKAVLTYQRGKTGKGRVVINVPYHLKRR